MFDPATGLVPSNISTEGAGWQLNCFAFVVYDNQKVLVKQLRYMPATYVGQSFRLRTLQTPLTSKKFKQVVRMAFNVQIAGLTTDKDTTNFVSYKANLLYIRFIDLAF